MKQVLIYTLILVGCGKFMPSLVSSVIGENNLEHVADIDDRHAKALSSPLLYLSYEDQGLCSANLVADDLLLTNHHCFNRIDCEFMTIRQFDEKTGAVMHWQCEEVLVKQRYLDFAIARIKSVSGQRAKNRNVAARLAKNSPRQLAQLILPSFPDGFIKKLDRSAECVFKDVEASDALAGKLSVTHTCDTNSGSSGSLLFNANTGAAEALHWGGLAGQHNFAIPMWAILEYLEQSNADIYEQLTIQVH